LVATDDGASVALTCWRLGRDAPCAPYAAPIVAGVPGQTLLPFFSVDTAGNQKALHSRWLLVSADD